jgi:hypothetical protein
MALTVALFHVPLWVTWEWGGRPYVLPKEGGRAPILCISTTSS